MAAKAILVLCAQVLLIQPAFSQCLGRVGLATPYSLAGRDWAYDGLAYDGLAGRGYGYDGLGLGYGYDGIGCGGLDYTVTSGGGLPVSSASACPPVGVSVASENEYGGRLCAAGELPFVGTVGVEGVLPTAGAGAVNYGCGNGETAMESVADILAAPAIGAFGPAAIAAPGLGYRAGLAGHGCGCGCGYGRI